VHGVPDGPSFGPFVPLHTALAQLVPSKPFVPVQTGSGPVDLTTTGTHCSSIYIRDGFVLGFLQVPAATLPLVPLQIGILHFSPTGPLVTLPSPSKTHFGKALSISSFSSRLSLFDGFFLP
jgi:hypothetical protein